MSLTVWQRNIVDETGDIVPGASVEVRRESDSALATLYDNADGTGTPLANPLTADVNGFVQFYTTAGAHRITATLGAFTATWRHETFGDAQNYRVGVAAAADLPTRADADARYLMQSQDLADLADVATARDNLGMGTAALLDEGTDPDDLPDVATVESLIVAYLATLSSVYQPLDADLTALAGLAGTGIPARTGANTWEQRVLTGTDRVAVTDGNGVAGNPTFDLVPLTADKAMITDSNGFPAPSAADASDLDAIAGAVAPYQEQLARVASTGILYGGVLSINGGDNTKFDCTEIGAVFVTHATPSSVPTVSYVTAGPFTAQTVTNIGTQLVTYLALDSAGVIQQFNAPLTPQQRRTYADLGAVIHSNLANINAVNQIVQTSMHAVSQLHDLMNFIGPLNLTGNKYSANGANLNVNVSAGTAFKFGCNFQTDEHDPHRVSLSAGTAITFRYRTQTGAEGSDITSIDPNNYDNAGVITAVPTNKFTVQVITRFQSGLTRIQYGQTVYDSMNDAIAGMQTDAFVTETNIAENGIIRSHLVVQEGTTALNNTSDAMFFEIPKFGGAVANAGGALTFANIVAALGYTPADVAGDTFTGLTSIPTLLVNTTTDDGVNKLQVNGSTLTTKLNVSGTAQELAYLLTTNSATYIRFGNSGATAGYIGYSSSGDFSFQTAATERLTIKAGGNALVGTTTDDAVGKLQVNGPITHTPGASVTPANNGQITFEFTDNTTLTFKGKGSDGTVRTATLTLA